MSAASAPLANSAMMSTLTVHCHLEDEKVREMTCYSPSYAKARKMKSLRLHTHSFHNASLRGLPFFSSSVFSLNLCMTD